MFLRIQLLANPWRDVSEPRKTERVELRYLYVQELVQSGLIRLCKVLGTLNPADILTKYVGKDTLSRRLGTLGLIPK